MISEQQTTSPIPLRLSRELRDRVYTAALRLGTSRSAIVRMALLNQLAEIECGVIRLRSTGAGQVEKAGGGR